MTDIKQIAEKLSEAQKSAIINIEKDGNGKYFYQIHGLAKAGLMARKPVPALLMAKAFRVNDIGQQVRTYLLEKADG